VGIKNNKIQTRCPKIKENGMIDLLGKFVTAKWKNRKEARQGWVIQVDPLIIEGQSGMVYECEGVPVIVINPPQKPKIGE
jgi:hypothetical protein